MEDSSQQQLSSGNSTPQNTTGYGQPTGNMSQPIRTKSTGSSQGADSPAPTGQNIQMQPEHQQGLSRTTHTL